MTGGVGRYAYASVQHAATQFLEGPLRGHDERDGSLFVKAKAKVSKTCGDPFGLKTEAGIHIL